MKTEDFTQLREFVAKELQGPKSDNIDELLFNLQKLSNSMHHLLDLKFSLLNEYSNKTVELEMLKGKLKEDLKINSQIKLNNENEFHSNMLRNEQYQKLYIESEKIKNQITYLEDVLAEYKNKGFRIKNITELLKIKMGIM